MGGDVASSDDDDESMDDDDNDLWGDWARGPEYLWTIALYCGYKIRNLLEIY